MSRAKLERPCRRLETRRDKLSREADRLRDWKPSPLSSLQRAQLVLCSRCESLIGDVEAMQMARQRFSRLHGTRQSEHWEIHLRETLDRIRLCAASIHDRTLTDLSLTTGVLPAQKRKPHF